MEEIVVTAQKRAERIQDVPISIQAFTNEHLDATGLDTANDLTMITPGFQVTKNGAANTPFIRGIGFQDATAGQESPVSTYVDGVYYPLAFTSDIDLSNVERVELLKGPQGTLFGRNATGGLVNIITKDPSHEFGGEARIFGGNYERWGGSVYLTGPITNNLAANVVVAYSDQERGFGKNVSDVLRPGYDDRKILFARERSIRSKWKWETESTDVTFGFDYLKKNDDQGISRKLFPGALGVDGAFVYGACIAQGGNDATCRPLAVSAATRSPADFREITSNVTPRIEVESYGAFARIDHEFGPTRFVSISGVRVDDVENPLDEDIIPLNVVDVVPVLSFNDSFTQELQVLSADDSRLSWIAGLFYLHSRAGVDITLEGLAFTGAQSSNIFGAITTDSYSGFGELRYKISDRVGVTLGARYTKDERTLDGANTLNFMDGSSVEDKRQLKNSFSKATYRAVADLRVRDDALLYASYNRGFKSGNFGAASLFDPPFEPEVLDAYEIGLKSQWLARRLTLNVAAFYYDYSNLQVTVQEGVRLRTENAANAELYGVELDTQASIGNHVDLFAGLSWIESEYTDYQNATVFVPTGFGGNMLLPEGSPGTDVSGNTLARTPKFTANLGVTIHAMSAFGQFSATAAWYYNDGFPWQPDGRLRQSSYSLTNLTVGWEAPSEKVGAQVKIRNLTDEDICVFCGSSALSDYLAAGSPRTVTAEVFMRF